jgi:CRP-like cAMP-binding protein
MINPNLFLNLFRDKEAQSYPAGQYIFKAGDRGETMYIVTEGEVDILEGSTVLDTIGPGSIVGELALIDDEPRCASVRAKTNCRLVPVNRHRFLFMVQETPFFGLAVMKVLADRLRKMDAKFPASSADLRL